MQVFLHIRITMNRASSDALRAAFAKSPKLAAMTQIEIAKATGIHQSQISRLMKGDFRRLSSRNVVKLCDYAQIPFPSCRRISRRLKETVEQVWNGSAQQEQALVKLLQAAAMLATVHVANESNSVTMSRASRMTRVQVHSRPKRRKRSR
jgi:predicted XRE-type DNA-binding protein